MLNLILAQTPVYRGQHTQPPQLQRPSSQDTSRSTQQLPYITDPYVACKMGESDAGKETSVWEEKWFALGCIVGLCVGPFGYIISLFVRVPSPKGPYVNMSPAARKRYEKCYRRKGKEKLQGAAIMGTTSACLILGFLLNQADESTRGSDINISCPSPSPPPPVVSCPYSYTVGNPGSFGLLRVIPELEPPVRPPVRYRKQQRPTQHRR